MKDLHWNFDGAGTINLKGEITETANFEALLAVMDGSIEIDLSGITRINSTGVREWIHFARKAGEVVDHLTFTRCSIAIVQQLNMIANFAGSGTVTTVMAPFFCPACDTDSNELIDVTKGPVDVDNLKVDCPSCGADMEFDDLPDEYFSFTRQRR